MSTLDDKIRKFCAEYGLSPQQTRIVAAMMAGALTNEAIRRRTGMTQGALSAHLWRIAKKTMTISRVELLYLFYEGRRGE